MGVALGVDHFSEWRCRVGLVAGVAALASHVLVLDVVALLGRLLFDVRRRGAHGGRGPKKLEAKLVCDGRVHL